MNTNENLIHTLYAAFASRDGAGMADCYHKDATFADPVFLELKGEQIGAMWKMLCLQGKDLTIEVYDIKADEVEGQATWEAKYGFGKPPRPVHNFVHAKFEFSEGKIIKHVDHFKLWKWSRMALGPLGLMLGWHSGVQKKIQQQAMSNLKKFISRTKTV
jgi:ketosteroid isomerase-like protein